MTARDPGALTAADRFVAGIETASIPVDVFCDDAILDATVPNWRFSVSGAEAIQAELSRWYGNPGHFDALRRMQLPEGEVVEYTLTWEEDGVPHTCHQVHILGLAGGRIAADTVFCGGRWPASLVAQMASTGRG